MQFRRSCHALARRSCPFLIAAIIAVMTGCGSASSPNGPSPAATGSVKAGSSTPISGWVHADGVHLIDSAGHQVRFLGANDSALNTGSGGAALQDDSCNRHWSEPSNDQPGNLHDWGFNTIRLAVGWANLEPTPPTVNPDGTVVHNWNAAFLVALDHTIQRFAAAHVAVILDLHQSLMSPAFHSIQKTNGLACEGEGFPTWLYPNAANEKYKNARCDFFADRTEPGVPVSPQAGFTAAWHTLAQRYSNNPTVVAADLFNEPDPATDCSVSGDQLRALYTKVGSEVRAASPHIVLILEETSVSYKYGVLLTTLPQLSNVMYSFHFYPASWDKGKTEAEGFKTRAAGFNVPLYVGEFDAFGATRNHAYSKHDPNWEADLAAFLQWCQSNDVSWAVWEYGGGAESMVRKNTTEAKQPLISDLQQGL